MKSKRLSKILEIIEQNNVETQEELLDKLNESGFVVTQATISRDINELRLTKVMTSEGKYKYARYVNQNDSTPAFNYRSILSESIIRVDRAVNIIVIKTYPGMAQGVAAAIDDGI
jgi:transcriptional regulator of arginine metabolism